MNRTTTDFQPADGIPDEARGYFYDAANRLIREARDVGANGSIDSVRRLSYDSNGNLIRQENNLGSN